VELGSRFLVNMANQGVPEAAFRSCVTSVEVSEYAACLRKLLFHRCPGCGATILSFFAVGNSIVYY
jgi:hypothetical protein